VDGSDQTPASAVSAADSHVTLAERVTQAIVGSGFPPLLVRAGHVVLSGFVVEPEREDAVKVRWIGQPDVNDLPYRRTFLSVYAGMLLQACLAVQYRSNEAEPYLLCRLR